jgi:hypothetical protein
MKMLKVSEILDAMVRDSEARKVQTDEYTLAPDYVQRVVRAVIHQQRTYSPRASTLYIYARAAEYARSTGN